MRYKTSSTICTSNFRSKIIAYKNKMLNKNNINDKSTAKDKLRDCCKEPCRLNNQCLISNIIYRATIRSNKTTKQYLGSTGKTFKKKDIETTNHHLRI